MADYWKSQPRHYCEFCKCWIADNKPSRDYHEKGKKHQENVAKKIVEVRKKGVKKAKKEEEESSTLEQIEKAALKAFKEDMKRDPSLAQQYGVELDLPKVLPPIKPEVKHQNPSAKVKKNIRAKNRTENRPGAPPTLSKEPDSFTNQTEYTTSQEPTDEYDWQEATTSHLTTDVGDWEEATASHQLTDAEATVSQLSTDASDWHETISPEGYPYYWNSKTLEVTWVKPEGYVSPEVSEDDKKTELPVESQNEESHINSPEDNQNTATTELADSHTQFQTEGTSDMPTDIIDCIPLPNDMQEKPAITESEASSTEAESKEPDTVAEKKDLPIQPQRIPHRKAAPYGTWEQVQKQPEEVVDLQLPDKKEEVVKAIPLSEPKIKFREKKVDTLGAELVAFKKRKLNTAAIKLRKRDDDS